MVPAVSNGASPTPPYSGIHLSDKTLPLQDYHLLRSGFPPSSSSFYHNVLWSYNPHLALTKWVWALARSLATTGAITIVFSSSRYLDVSVPWVCFPCGIMCLQHTGLPHSDICGSIRICQSPQLFAAYHVLLRH